MLKDPAFWVLVAFCLFWFLFAKKIGTFVKAYLDDYINEIKQKKEEQHILLKEAHDKLREAEDRLDFALQKYQETQDRAAQEIAKLEHNTLVRQAEYKKDYEERLKYRIKELQDNFQGDILSSTMEKAIEETYKHIQKQKAGKHRQYISFLTDQLNSNNKD